MKETLRNERATCGISKHRRSSKGSLTHLTETVASVDFQCRERVLDAGHIKFFWILKYARKSATHGCGAGTVNWPFLLHEHLFCSPCMVWCGQGGRWGKAGGMLPFRGHRHGSSWINESFRAGLSESLCILSPWVAQTRRQGCTGHRRWRWPGQRRV